MYQLYCEHCHWEAITKKEKENLFEYCPMCDGLVYREKIELTMNKLQSKIPATIHKIEDLIKELSSLALLDNTINVHDTLNKLVYTQIDLEKRIKNDK